ncbi:unnamed protein product [Caenorhabditis sp. 36 PRJEB53466]|nr:unnamed protein product [Caenorhabditis sp. 36 PRJEB53466]
MTKIPLVFVVLLASAHAFDSSSSSESCEGSDEGHGHGGGHGGGGGRPRPGNGGGNGGCGAGWKRFNRPSGGWCIRVYGGILDQSVAESQCQSHGGLLSGVQNYEEITYITGAALSVMPQSTGSLWIGAKRTGACSNQPLTATCTATNSFYWTDGSASGVAGWVWDPSKQPDNAHGRTQQCVILLAAASSTVSVGTATWAANHLDDVSCSQVGMAPVSTRKVVGYVCGKRPRRN